MNQIKIFILIMKVIKLNFIIFLKNLVFHLIFMFRLLNNLLFK